MTTIYLDASALIAYFNKEDEFHELEESKI